MLEFWKYWEFWTVSSRHYSLDKTTANKGLFLISGSTKVVRCEIKKYWNYGETRLVNPSLRPEQFQALMNLFIHFLGVINLSTME